MNQVGNRNNQATIEHAASGDVGAFIARIRSQLKAGVG